MDERSAAYLKQFPAVKTNDSALQLDRLNAQIGIGSPAPSDVGPQIDQQKVETILAVSELLSEYFDDQKQKTSGLLAPVPVVAMEFLKQHKTELEAVKRHLVTAEVAVWELDPEAMADPTYPLPSLLNLFYLNRLLLVEAIAHSQDQNSKEMLRSLEITQQLQKPLKRRPDSISYLVSLLIATDHATILRHLDGVPAQLADSLLAMNYRKAGLQALNFEVWMTYGRMEKSANGREKDSESLEDWEKMHPFVEKMLPFARDYYRLAATDTAWAMSAYHQKLAEFNRHWSIREV